MIPLTLTDIARITGLAEPAGTATVTSVEFDSRAVRPGALFLALTGEQVDGHDYLAQAAAAGAVAALGSRAVVGELPYLRAADNDGVLAALATIAQVSHRQLPGLTTVGITGSAGKTTTKDLTAALLAAAGPTVAPPQSFNNELGHPYTVLRADEHTKYLVLELSARGIGHIAALTEVAVPKIGAVLNVGTAHVGEFGDQTITAQAKAELVQALGADGVAILNVDDDRVAQMASLTAARVLTVGRGHTADIWAGNLAADELDRASFDLHLPEDTVRVDLKLAGAHQVSNALTAAAIAHQVGLDARTIGEVLSQTGPASQARMAVHTGADGTIVINDAYNANPESVCAALASLAAIGARRGGHTWAVLGEMAELGPQAEAEHARVGRRAADLGIDRVLAVGGSAAAALAETAGGIHLDDRQAALACVVSQCRPGDVVLVKGSLVTRMRELAGELIAKVGQ